MLTEALLVFSRFVLMSSTSNYGEGFVNLSALMQSSGREVEGCTSSSPQATSSGVEISCQIWNRVRSS